MNCKKEEIFIKKDIYSLQIPIPIELADKLKELAEKDERSLRLYCKRVLQLHVEDTYENNTANDETNISNQNEIVKKKKKVGELKPQI